jgi:Holliday junction DNA helicase RuvA
MIGKLKGILDSIGDDTIIIDVNGVGYEVHCSARTLGSLPSVGEPCSMAIETHVRETEIKLFGFSNDMERDWFKLLQSVQGVGAKVALAIQSTLSAGDLASAIALQDKAMVARAPGVGPKVAQRIVLELKNKVPAFSGEAAAEMGLAHDIGDGVASNAVQDAVSALGNLGYSSQQAAGAVSSALAQAGEDADSATLIRMGLKELAS